MPHRYEVTGEYNTILGAVSRRLRRLSPPSARDHLVRTGQNYGVRQVEIWFRSRGCHLFLQGGCTMCNYGYSALNDADLMAGFVGQALSEVAMDQRTDLLVSPSGSFLDDWEVPRPTRQKILEIVSRTPWRQFGFETQANFVSDEAVTQVQAQLDNRPLKIGIGLESFSERVRRLCINKDLPQPVFLQAVRCAQKQGAETSVNVIIGAPFMSKLRQVADAIHTIEELTKLGVSEIFLFPVNVKIGTLVQWLWDHKYYTPPELWALCYVLLNSPAGAHKRISFAWHRQYYSEHIEVARKVLHRPAPLGADEAEAHQLNDILERYLQSRDPGEMHDHCSNSAGYGRWLERLTAPELWPDYCSIALSMSRGVMGEKWADEHAEEITRFATELKESAEVFDSSAP